MKFTLTLLLTFILAANVDGQVRVSISVIAGTYAMSDMSDLQNAFSQQYQTYGFSVSKQKQFPITPQVEIGVDFQTKKKGYWGGFFNYAGTQGVAGYGALPWLIQYQQNLTRYLAGVKRYQQLSENFYFVAKAGANFSKLGIDETVNINSNNESHSSSGYHSWWSPSVQPGFSWITSSGRSVGFEVSVGYEFNFSGKTQLNGYNNYYLISNGRPAKIDWSGLRAGVALTFSGK